MPSRGSVRVPSRSKRIAFNASGVGGEPVQGQGALHLHAQLEAFLVEVETRAVARGRILDGSPWRRAAQPPEQARHLLLEEGEVLGAAHLVDHADAGFARNAPDGGNRP